MPSITAKQFYDLVALCFAWRWDPDDARTQHGRIHAANWLLYHMGVYGKEVREIFTRDLNVANLFVRKCDVYYFDPGSGFFRDEVWSNREAHFLVAVPPHETFRPRHLLEPRGYNLFMTAVGQEHGIGLEEAYSSLVSKDRFEKAREERDEFFHVAGRKIAAARQAKIDEEAAAEDGKEP